MPGARSTRLLAALPALAVLLWAVPARAAVSFTASVSPTTIRSPAKLEYRLKMVNHGDREERFSVTLGQPLYGPSRPGYGRTELASVDRRGRPRIDPPATYATDLVQTFDADIASCGGAGAGLGVGDHGYGVTSYELDVALPAHSTSRVRARYATAQPLWQDLDLRLRFYIGTKLVTGARGTLKNTRVVRSPSPRVAGRRAAHIMFRTVPSRRAAVRRGTPLRIDGFMVPAMPGQHVDFRYRRIGDRGAVTKPTPAAVAYVGALGAFSTTWLPPRPGVYELWAQYEHASPGLHSDDTCVQGFRVGQAL